MGGAERGYLRLPETLGGGQIHYRRRFGAPDAKHPRRPMIVLLHQTPSDSAMYESLMAQLADPFDVVALDTPGFGMSDPLPATRGRGRSAEANAFDLAHVAAALHAAACTLSGDTFLLFGHHTGAAIALQMADDYPASVRALALSGPCLLSAELAARLRSNRWMPEMDTAGDFLATLWRRLREKDPDSPLAIAQRELAAALRAGSLYDAAYVAVAGAHTEAQLRRVGCPLWLCGGTDDTLYAAFQAACALRPDASLLEISGGRSYACEQQAAVLADSLRAFITEKVSG